MKLSIWQQFSSNHSAAFSIVAQFESDKKAVQVADEITTMLLETYSMLDPDDRFSGRSHDTPAQIKQRFEYDVAVGVTWMLNEQHVRRALQVFGNTIFVSDAPGYSNFDGSDRFFEKMLELRGGKVIANLEGISDIYMSIRARAKDETTAQHIIDTSEKKEYSIGEPDYIPAGIPAREGVGAISRNGAIVTFDRIYFSSYHFDTFSLWYSYIKSNDFSDVTITLKSGKKSQLILPFNEIERQIQIPFWGMFNRESNNVKYPPVVIATFKTDEEAQSAANTIREILYRVRDWSDTHTEESKRVWDVFWERLSPPEQEFQQKYNIEWTRSIVEWIHETVRIRPVDNIISLIGNRILLANKCNTWVGIAPFHLILPQLGATEVSIPKRNNYRDLICDIIVTAKTENLIWYIKFLIENLEKHHVPPWFSFVGGKAVEQSEPWQKTLTKLVKKAKERGSTYKHLSDLWLYKVVDSLDYDYAELTRVEQAEFVKALYDISFDLTQNFEQTSIESRLRDMRLNFLEIKQNGKELIIEHAHFRELCTWKSVV